MKYGDSGFPFHSTCLALPIVDLRFLQQKCVSQGGHWPERRVKELREEAEYLGCIWSICSGSLMRYCNYDTHGGADDTPTVSACVSQPSAF